MKLPKVDLKELFMDIFTSMVIIGLILSCVADGTIIVIVFSSGHWGWGLLLLSLFAGAIYFGTEYVRRP